MKDARHGTIRDLGMSAKKKLRQSMQSPKANTIRNTRERAAAALTTLAGVSIF